MKAIEPGGLLRLTELAASTHGLLAKEVVIHSSPLIVGSSRQAAPSLKKGEGTW